ncbi:MAG TPA: ABC transporter permease [Gemmatimonadales bacterium]|jgi:putative ABC transport system permease protein|nr:ABC transporter permease [Gemmatimonadales bacterium]
MMVGETVAVALQSIRANKMRAFLTMLGIIIGVGAVITMISLGNGAQKAVNDQISAMGARLLSIYPGQMFSRGVASSNRVSLTTDDADALKRDAHLLDAVAPELSSSYTVKYGNKNLNLQTVGTTANYATVHNYTMPYGQMFTDGDDQARERYVVLGADVPDMLEANPAALIHQTVLIRGIPFEVIGILSRKGAASGSFFNVDEQILIPLQTAQYRIQGTNRVRSITVEVAEGVPMEQGMVDLERIMRREHKIRPGGENDFTIRNQMELLATQQQATEVFGSLLAGIAAVSLLVGGIGIMNIMLVSVTERTREIGVRKALGATRINIMLQFLIEALVLCLIGGLLGVGLGTWAADIMAKSYGWNTLISFNAILMAFAFSAGVGLVFGIWPASRAAKLDPIVALRYE